MASVPTIAECHVIRAQVICDLGGGTLYAASGPHVCLVEVPGAGHAGRQAITAVCTRGADV